MLRVVPSHPKEDTRHELFRFTAASTPSQPFRFVRKPEQALTCSASSPVMKRPRALSDVDGDGPVTAFKKKRRLRLVLITSRLSRPFSSPPSHIVDRGVSKIAVWAKQKALGRNVLRKAAIMNSIREHAAAARRLEQKKMEMARQAFMRQQSCVAQVPRRQYIPLPPSPLGLSNYDALDLEDDLQNSDCDDESDGSSVYSDFSILEPSQSVVDDYDSLDHFDSLPLKRRPPSPPDEKELEMMREKERQKEVAFIQLGAD
ncbi:MAG: hypothetical protein M1825_001989 [Sarcosagium campestre]|nr:MAG: hypothetical protein M1825_001989 [Sarcosagium campestre]